MTNLRKYFGFRYSNNRKMFSRNRIKRAPAVAREGCGGSGAPGAGLRGARGRRLQDFPGRRLQGFPERRLQDFPERRLQDFPERRLQDFPERRLRVSQSVVCRTSRRAVRASFRSHPELLREALSGRTPDRFPDISSDMFPDIFSGDRPGRIRCASGPEKEAERGQPHARG